ncbi:MAG: OsmC family protein [Candidatus Cloacimonadales bacterium]|nr:OsmC family protein [Candidatus Cloacimonadales bacterium]
MAFDAELNGHHFVIDADEKTGGENLGPRPKGLLLSSLAGCTGMDVVSILKKMKIENCVFNLEVTADSTEEHPKTYHTIHLNYIFEGNDLPVDKLKRAVELSETRYCGVSAMLRKAAEIKTRIILNGKDI